MRQPIRGDGVLGPITFVIVDHHGIIAVEILGRICINFWFTHGSVIWPIQSLISEICVDVEAALLICLTVSGLFNLRPNKSFAPLIARHMIIFKSLNFFFEHLIVHDFALIPLLLGHLLRQRIQLRIVIKWRLVKIIFHLFFGCLRRLAGNDIVGLVLKAESIFVILLFLCFVAPDLLILGFTTLMRSQFRKFFILLYLADDHQVFDLEFMGCPGQICGRIDTIFLRSASYGVVFLLGEQYWAGENFRVSSGREILSVLIGGAIVVIEIILV